MVQALLDLMTDLLRIQYHSVLDQWTLVQKVPLGTKNRTPDCWPLGLKTLWHSPIRFFWSAPLGETFITLALLMDYQHRRAPRVRFTLRPVSVCYSTQICTTRRTESDSRLLTTRSYYWSLDQMQWTTRSYAQKHIYLSNKSTIRSTNPYKVIAVLVNSKWTNKWPRLPGF